MVTHFHLTQEQKFLLFSTGLTVLALSLGSSPARSRITTLCKWIFSKTRLSLPSKALGIKLGPLWIADEARLRHSHIVGATGTGKTCVLEQLIYHDIARGHGALIIDPKGDRELYSRLKSFCKKIGRAKDLKLLSSSYVSESVRWNPCRLGNASELQTKWFQSGIYSESYYAKACEHALLRASNSLLLEMPNGFTLSNLISKIDQFSGDEKNKDLSGLKYELSNLSHGEWGAILCADNVEETQEEISILDITRKQEILFVDLPTEAKAVQSTRVGKLLLQEIMLISGLRKMIPTLRGSQPFSIFIDEFDAFASEAFVTFLNKGRSSGFMIHMAHQTLSDLDRISDSFKGQILGNCSVRFIFRQDLPDDAEVWARFLGTDLVVKKTFQTKDGAMTGMSSNRETLEFRISPDQIKSLKVGEFIFSEKVSGIHKRLRLPYPMEPPRVARLPKHRDETLISKKIQQSTDYLNTLKMMSGVKPKKEVSS